MEMIKFEKEELTVQEEMKQKLREFKRLEKEIKRFETELKETALVYMEKNNIKELDSEILSVKYVDSYFRNSVDTDRLKEEGVYELYLKETEVKPSVRITIK